MQPSSDKMSPHWGFLATRSEFLRGRGKSSINKESNATAEAPITSPAKPSRPIHSPERKTGFRCAHRCHTHGAEKGSGIGGSEKSWCPRVRYILVDSFFAIC